MIEFRVIGVILARRQAEREAILVLLGHATIKVLQRVLVAPEHPLEIIQDPLGIRLSDK